MAAKYLTMVGQLQWLVTWGDFEQSWVQTEVQQKLQGDPEGVGVDTSYH